MAMSKKELRRAVRNNPKLAESLSKEVSRVNRKNSTVSKSSSSSGSKKSGGLFGGLFGGLRGLGGGLDFNSIRSKVTETNMFLQELNSAITTADHLRHHLGPLMKKETKSSAQESNNQLPTYKRGEKPPRL